MIEPIEGDVVFEVLDCFICIPKTQNTLERRALCVERQRHNPGSQEIAHQHSTEPLRLCQDCFTLVHP